MGRARASPRTTAILKEILARELAAKTFYEELYSRLDGTEFERFADRIKAMVDEERGHAEAVKALLAKYG